MSESLAKLRRRVQHEFPLHLTTQAVGSGTPIELSQDDVLSMLMIDPHDLIGEAATSPMLYAYFARFRRALEVQADDATRAYATWKAEKQQELQKKMQPKVRKDGKPAAKQGPTADETAAYYRTLPDYNEVARLPSVLKAQAALLEDLMWAMKMKADMVTSVSQTAGVHRSIDRQGDDAAERRAIAEGQRAAIAQVLQQPKYAPPPARNPAPPVPHLPVPPVTPGG